MHVTTATALALVAVLVACVAAALALMALNRAGRESQRGLTLDLSLALVGHEKGLRLLTDHAARSEEWWVDAPPADRQEIERALSMWELVAWYAATGRIDRRTVLELFRGRIVELWEQAYPYIQVRRADQPELWSSLSELYVDAYDAADPLMSDRLPTFEAGPPAAMDEVAPQVADEPEPEQLARPEEPTAADEPAAPVAEHAPVAETAPEQPDRRLIDLRIALHRLDAVPPATPPATYEQVVELAPSAGVGALD